MTSDEMTNPYIEKERAAVAVLSLSMMGSGWFAEADGVWPPILSLVPAVV